MQRDAMQRDAMLRDERSAMDAADQRSAVLLSGARKRKTLWSVCYTLRDICAGEEALGAGGNVAMLLTNENQ